MVGNEIFLGWHFPTATVVCAKNGTDASISQDASIHLAIRMCSSPELNVVVQGNSTKSERPRKGKKSVCQPGARSVKAIRIKCANPCADCVLTQSADPVNTILGWKRVPAIR